MTKEELIRMAREAGLLPHPENIVYQDPMFEGRIKTFAALVAAAEREACAELIEDMAVQHPKYIAAAIRARGQE
jgi:hypothetical protein